MKRRLESPADAAARLAAESLKPSERAQLWTRLERSSRAKRRRRVPALWLAAAGALAALSFGLWLRSTRSGLTPQPTANACAIDPAEPRLTLGERCAPARVRIDGDEWLLTAGAQLAHIEHGARVVQGRVRFRVRHRADTPFQVQVSHGQLTVIGTLFEVEQQVGRGSVSVSEGAVEFVWKDGARERVAAGESLRWPRNEPPPGVAAPEPEAPVGPARDADAKRAPRAKRVETEAKAIDMDHVMERLLQLRSQRRLSEAIGLLRDTLNARGIDAVQRERLSYELGIALESDGQPACAHWQNHAQRFAGSTRHARVLARRLEQCRGE